MKTKLLLLFISVLLLSACNKKQEAENILQQFIHNNVPDQREVIFNINPEIKNGYLVLTGETDSEVLKNRLLSEFKTFKINDKITLLPDTIVGDKKFGLINLSVANLRTNPSHPAELATQGLMGTPVKILKKENGWYLVQTPDHYISWVDDGGLFPITKETLFTWKNTQRAIIISELEFLTSDTVIHSGIISDLTMGNIIEINGKAGTYLDARLPDGRAGFIPQNCCIDFEEFKQSYHPEKESLAKLAQSFIGRPYLWGGTSTRAMDCSGFVKMVYFMHGIILARDASLQTKYGGLIQSSENLDMFETGDLLFFGRDSVKISHVALSLGGDEYINASGKIMENSFNPGKENYSESKRNTFIRCRRIIGAEGIQWIKEHPWY